MIDQDEIKELDASIQRSKEIVELGACLDRLSSNRDFRTIVQEGYFKQEAVRLVHLRADPAMQAKDRQDGINKQLDSIACFSQYLREVQQLASMAKRAIVADEATREQMAAEELNDGV